MLTTRIPFDVDGDAAGTIAISRDITEQKQMREDLEERALYDRMTGLPNRSLFRDCLRQTIERSRSRGTSFALAFLDLDNFKEVNDSLGLLAGDELIVGVADRLCEMMRAEDTVARIGGDEFTIILQTIDGREHLETIGRRIRRLFEEPFDIQGAEVHVTVSIGFSLPDLETLLGKPFDESFESMTRAADRAMYRAKERMGTSWRLAETQNQAASSRRIQRENQIREGIARGEFFPRFQPIVRTDDGTVLAYEMLARWNHAQQGMISPAEFIPIAEDSALIDGISENLVDRACDRFAETKSEGFDFDGVSLYVNVSANQLGRSEVLERLQKTVDEKLPDEMELAFEVTETALLRHGSYADALRDSGHRMLIDDFGTGHSSLSRLKEMPVDGLKLDMEFVQGIGASSSDEAIVETVVGLGQRLGLPVTAEGVETKEQFEFLQEINCSAAQGYWLKRPGPLEEVI